MTFDTLTVGDLATNGYLLHENGDAVLIDPGAEPATWIGAVDALDVTVRAILLTHGHADHIGAVGVLREQWPDAEVAIHEADAPMLIDPQRNLAAHMGVNLNVGEPDRSLADGEVLEYGSLRLTVRHLPGHTPGHVVLIHEDGHVFAGDTLFAGGIGRWDFPNGDGRALIEGIREHILSLPGDTKVHPGHGPSTTVNVELRMNPYLDPGFLSSFGDL